MNSVRRGSITINQIIDDQDPEQALREISAHESEAGSPPRLSPPKSLQSSFASATEGDSKPGMRVKAVTFDRAAEEVSPTPTRERRRPSMQPRTAVAHSKAQLLKGNSSVMISQEMGEAGIDDTSTRQNLSDDIVGTYSCHGMEPSDDDGHIDKINQDCGCCGYPFAGLTRTALFSVYDGHGQFGHDVSQECMHTIYHSLVVADQELADDPCGTLADAFEACNIHLRIMACSEVLEVNALDSGTCAVVACVHDRELFVAGVGDCRCVLGIKPWVDGVNGGQVGDGDREQGSADDGELQAIALSTDHKVDLPAEQARIESKGGWVRGGVVDDEGDYIPARMYEKEGMPQLGPGLCISRSLGDLNALRCGLIPTPEVFSHEIGESDRYLILGTDGLWEFVSNGEAVRIVDDFYSKGLPAIDACRFLIAKAAVAWRQEEGDYRDDITAMVVYLPELMQLFDSSSPTPTADEKGAPKE